MNEFDTCCGTTFENKEQMKRYVFDLEVWASTAKEQLNHYLDNHDDPNTKLIIDAIPKIGDYIND